MTTPWNPVVYDVNSRVSEPQILAHLRDDIAAVVVLKNAIPDQAREGLLREILSRRQQATVSAYSNGALTTFGPYLAKHLNDPSEYFQRANTIDELFATQDEDIGSILRLRLQKVLGLDSFAVAAEPDGTPYAPAVLRIHGNGIGNPLHNDNIARDAANTGLALAGLRHQFSCITCIQECDADGELLHYRRRWQPEHELFKVNGGLGYHDQAVAGAECCTFRPSSGDVYIIDPTNFHAIRPVSGQDRITLGFFFGFFDDNCRKAVCWS